MEPSLQLAVVIPVYNRRELLLETLESVRTQSVMPSRLIIVDDGSSDGSKDEAAKWLSTHRLGCKVKIICQSNSGVSVARNRGAQECKDADLIAFLDSDDLWPANFVEQALCSFTENPEIVAATSDRLDITYHAGWNTESMIRWPMIKLDASQICRRKIFAYVSATVFRVSAYARAGGYLPSLNYGEDYILYLIVSSYGSWGRIASLPAMRRQYSRESGYNVTHLSSCHDPDILLNYAKSLEIELIKNKCDHLFKRAIAHRWRKAGRALALAGRKVEAHDCYRQAQRSNTWDLKVWINRMMLKYSNEIA